MGARRQDVDGIDGSIRGTRPGRTVGRAPGIWPAVTAGVGRAGVQAHGSPPQTVRRLRHWGKPMDDKRVLLRHTLATVAYRGGKAVRGAPASFATFASGEPPKTPAQILAHIGDLYDWALSIAQGAQKWNNSTPLPWDDEVARFFG